MLSREQQIKLIFCCGSVGFINFEFWIYNAIEVERDWEVPVWIIVHVNKYPVAALKKRKKFCETN